MKYHSERIKKQTEALKYAYRNSGDRSLSVQSGNPVAAGLRVL
ncbi:MAG: hypothetical protein V3S16_11875 [Candidatus Desulfatibia sp.]